MQGNSPFPPNQNEPVLQDDLYEPYSQLIPVYIKGLEYKVPENNSLLRILQYLNSEVAYGNFCWNGDCRNCLIVIRRGTDAQEVTALACLTKIVPGLHILKLPPGVKIDPPEPK